MPIKGRAPFPTSKRPPFRPRRPTGPRSDASEFAPPPPPPDEPKVTLEEVTGLPDAVREALKSRGFTHLTRVQSEVLAPHTLGRDLRVSSQTGSGKTIAFGFLLIRAFEEAKLAAEAAGTPKPEFDSRAAFPKALVLTPTRELAAQVAEELATVLTPMKYSVTAVAGGSSYRDESRALSRNPEVIVATPGRLIDHLERERIRADQVQALILDEADRMLDMGFAEELEAIVGKLPKERRTHLVSATFSRMVQTLADRFQKDSVRIEGTRLGAANADIEHRIAIVPESEHIQAVINILLASPGEQTLIFTRMRAEVADVTNALLSAGFGATALSGEMSQDTRNRALEAFKSKTLPIMVATDVAARGIDVDGIGLVIHLNPPSNSENYTHRSGRTGRAGKKGRSIVIANPGAANRTEQLMGRARVPFKFERIPNPDTIAQIRDDMFYAKATAFLVSEEGRALETNKPPEFLLAERLVRDVEALPLIAYLLRESGHSGHAEVRPVRSYLPGDPRERTPRDRGPERGDREPRMPATRRDWPEAEQPFTRKRSEQRNPMDHGDGWVSFEINIGDREGATPPKLLAMLCRRGDIRGIDVGSIRVGDRTSAFEIKKHLADHFFVHAAREDRRDPQVKIRALGSQPPGPPREEAQSAPQGTLGEDRAEGANASRRDVEPSRSDASNESSAERPMVRTPRPRPVADEYPKKKPAARRVTAPERPFAPTSPRAPRANIERGEEAPRAGGFAPPPKRGPARVSKGKHAAADGPRGPNRAERRKHLQK